MPDQELPPEKPGAPPLEHASASESKGGRPHYWRHSGFVKRVATWALFSIASLWLLGDIWNRFYIWAYTPHQYAY